MEKLGLNPYNDLNRFWTWLGVLVGMMIIAIWLYPDYLYYVDPWWLIWPWIIVIYALAGHYFAEVHRGGYSLTTYLSHSSIAEPEPTAVIPAQHPFPRLLVFRKGRGRYGGRWISDGASDGGWLVVPEDQVVDMNGHHVAFTRTLELEPGQLPEHVRDFLSKREEFSPYTIVEYGEDPFDEEWDKARTDDNPFKWDLAAAQAEEKVTERDLIISELRKNVRRLTKDLGILGGKASLPYVQPRTRRGDDEDDR